MNFATKDWHGQRFTADTLGLESFSTQWARHVAQAIEAALREEITLAEGRTPEPAEIAAHGQRLIHESGRTDYTWRGKIVLSVFPAETGADSICRIRLERGSG